VVATAAAAACGSCPGAGVLRYRQKRRGIAGADGGTIGGHKCACSTVCVCDSVYLTKLVLSAFLYSVCGVLTGVVICVHFFVECHKSVCAWHTVPWQRAQEQGLQNCANLLNRRMAWVCRLNISHVLVLNGAFGRMRQLLRQLMLCLHCAPQQCCVECV
jgi:hypothetical protein